MYQLQQLCCSKGLPKIRAFIKKYKLFPDSICVMNASKIKNNDKIIALLISLGAPVTIDCVKAYTQTLDLAQLTLLIDNFIKNNNITMK
jgi:hypothetical protein